MMHRVFLAAVLAAPVLVSADTDQASMGEALSAAMGRPVQELKEMMLDVYNRIDTAGRDFIDSEDVRIWVTKLYGASNLKHARTELKLIDKDGDGLISWGEIKQAMLEAEGGQHDEANEILLRKRVNVADIDKDGKLNDVELGYLLSPGLLKELAQLESDDILESQDTNKDGKISFEEFSTHEMEHADADKEELQSEYDNYDTNKDAFICPQEIMDAFAEPRPQMINDATAEILGDKDKLTKADFGENWTKYTKSPITDREQLLRFPKSYPLDPPMMYENVEAHEEDMDYDEGEGADPTQEEEADLHDEL